MCLCRVPRRSLGMLIRRCWEVVYMMDGIGITFCIRISDLTFFFLCLNAAGRLVDDLSLGL